MTLTQADLPRKVIARMLDWEDAHAGFDRVVAGLPASFKGAYKELDWPADHWPKGAKPPSASAWPE